MLLTMEESDDYVTVETVDDGIIQHSSGPSSPPNTAGGESSYADQFFVFGAANGWYIILAIGILYIIWKRFVQPRLQGSTRGYQSTATVKQNAEDILARQEAMELARKRMQEQYDQKAQEFSIKKKEKEERARQEKLKELERYTPGLGCTNRSKAPQAAEDSHSNLLNRKTNQSKLRPEYNPLMGGGSGTCFRPVRRGGAGGG